MCLTEYNEAETMNMFKEEGREEGREEGLEEGREEGREAERVETVEKLIRKGKNIEEIADLLDLSLDFVREISCNLKNN